jgi:hypothetical protein
MDIFEACSSINDHVQSGNDLSARNELIKVLDFHEREGIFYSPLVNHLIREVGLYPYLNPETSSWEDRFIYESFKVNVGFESPVTLHREQSLILKKLLEGKSLAVSAPTSFGKSFVIDAFISINKPQNIVIIVPTIALADETRRRLQQKFSDEYKVITTTDIEVSNKNIFIFPQERAISYIPKLESIDILVIDEFYKASVEYDKERASSLLRAMIQLGKISKQKYFLAPNISTLKDNPFTRDVEFIHLDFNTVYLEKHDLYKVIGSDVTKKSAALLSLIKDRHQKTLIYAGTYSNITQISNLIIDKLSPRKGGILTDFSRWLSKNYSRNWVLTSLVDRGFGVHNGKLHRSLSQIQIKLFEIEDGLKGIISTSSIIEGVNTSAENVIIWKNKNGRSKLNDFTYRNIIGRGGRMFKHFVGNIYLLDTPPDPAESQLTIDFPDDLLPDLDENEFKQDLTSDQVAKIISYKEEMADLLGVETYYSIYSQKIFQSSNASTILKVVREIAKDPSEWKNLSYLNSSNPDDWDYSLYRILKIVPAGWDASYTAIVNFTKAISNGWELPFPELVENLNDQNISIDDFFGLERSVSYKLSALLNDVNLLLKKILKDPSVDISPFIFKVSHAFLPPVVYQLEEYGLPRMISRKLQDANVINFEQKDVDLHDIINTFLGMSVQDIVSNVLTLDKFDIFILEYFYDGIMLKR